MLNVQCQRGRVDLIAMTHGPCHRLMAHALSYCLSSVLGLWLRTQYNRTVRFLSRADLTMALICKCADGFSWFYPFSLPFSCYTSECQGSVNTLKTFRRAALPLGSELPFVLLKAR